MALTLAQKAAIVAEISEVAKQAMSLVAVGNRGISVPEMTRLRKEAREVGVYLRVVRNTLARRAVEGTEFECLKGSLTGPLVLAFGQQEPSAPARLFKRFVKENEKLDIRAFSISGVAYPPEQIELLASLPTRDEAIAQLLSVMQAPIVKLARTMIAAPEKLVRTLAAVQEQKQAGGVAA